jgi:hypothetical protein
MADQVDFRKFRKKAKTAPKEPKMLDIGQFLVDGDGVKSCPHCGRSEPRDWMQEKRKEEWRFKKRVNEVQEEKLIPKSDVTELVIKILSGVWDQVVLIPDVLVPTLYEQTQTVMRQRTVEYIENMSRDLIKTLEGYDQNIKRL